jgi:acyl-CoA reductase-like NAD-dependent aldehyde dehydrogenase
MTDFKLLINGKLVAGASSFDVLNPATEEVVAKCPKADRAQLDQAVAAAKAAFPAWSKRPLKERAALLNKVADALEARAEEFARLLVQEQGKPLPMALWEVGGTAGGIRYFASLELPDKVLKDDAETKIILQHKPLGVVAAITPWNFPLILLSIKLGPGLLAGNTMIVKPAPTTPLTTLLLGEVMAQILPPGVVNVLADQNELGDAITGHPDIAKVAFTGSTATGKKVMASASSSLKRLTLELGGNDAAIVLDDCDPKEVAPKIFGGATLNSGQVCLAIKRVYAPKAMYDELCDELAKLAKDAVVGDGFEQGTQLGPIQNKMQFDKVKGFLDAAHKDGKVIAGGAPLDRKGYFIPPTIVRDIPDDSKLVQEEQFAPILPIMSYTDLDDAIARANDSEYGLGGTVWTNDLKRGQEVASQVLSGTIWVNKHLDLPFDIPFGGAKQSGIGVEYGQEGLEEFTQATTINMSKVPLSAVGGH